MSTTEKINWTARDINDLRDLRTALDTMPKKELGHGHLEDPSNGCVCALGALAWKRQLLDEVRKYNLDQATSLYPDLFNATDCFTSKVWKTNDLQKYRAQSNDARWLRMRAWVEKQITTWEKAHPEPVEKMPQVVAHTHHTPDPLVEASREAQQLRGGAL